jgi:hypothetical protein
VAAKSGNYNGPGNVYVFEKTGSQWNQIANLVDANHFQSNSLNDNIAINGDTIVIGNTALASSQGFTYRNVTVYERINRMWSATATTTSPDQSGSFGDTVSLDGDALVVSGTELIDVFNSQFVGVDYIYRRINNQWTYEQTIKFDKTSTSTIHVSGDYLVLGGWQPYRGPNGTYFAYLYQRSDDGVWLQHATLDHPGIVATDAFGSAMAIDGTSILVGAFNRDGHTVDAGDVFAYDNSLSRETSAPLVEPRSYAQILDWRSSPYQLALASDAAFDRFDDVTSMSVNVDVQDIHDALSSFDFEHVCENVQPAVLETSE